MNQSLIDWSVSPVNKDEEEAQPCRVMVVLATLITLAST